ncbi:MAG: hypothetical protein RR891_02630 [Clostridium sp.]
MSIGCMRCNKNSCNGLIIYEDADYDIKKAVLNGDWIVDNDLICDTCGRKFKAVVSHVFVHEDEATGNIEELDSACITEWEKKHR